MTAKYPRHAVLWDMDGVLVNTGEIHYLSWKQTFDELGDPFTREQFTATFGMNNSGILEVLYGEKPSPERLAKIGGRKEILFRQMVVGNAHLLPGVDALLKKFSALEMKQAIASSAPPENIDVVVAELKIGTYLDALISGFDIPGKPDPGVFLKSAQAVGVDPGNCIVIEDAITGVEGARNAGMRCIAVTTTNPAEALAGADFVVNSLEQVDDRMLTALLDARGTEA